ncbi:hypothetical protein QJV15_08815 [Listeria cossartiae subsp. cayugensis]|uniref:hypothetical protein n=1 Tax=Listeria cossartiae TaxID=2838249 RepID=UPI0028826494|nr:hypothetical protein [Listeria cossartiae subsp. cayugensis]MDT0008931.1 hypothetical protein [Listeria cossartiae subsp. cayugensis]MDT0030763.1 hypothetical protein [Listeria cossartiae subsp. cayugensis]MDT0038878.1 hypothetical protein [Listeria cossartiae subsp. cayugensis]MDT0044462.1 hypothetical protein [Listeria cossartiae subsp. cayugensis]
MRQPFQVLVIPFIKKAADYQYGVLLRNDEDVWQVGGNKAALYELKERLKNNDMMAIKKD